jgi:hypothetical protein
LKIRTTAQIAKITSFLILVHLLVVCRGDVRIDCVISVVSATADAGVAEILKATTFEATAQFGEKSTTDIAEIATLAAEFTQNCHNYDAKYNTSDHDAGEITGADMRGCATTTSSR